MVAWWPSRNLLLPTRLTRPILVKPHCVIMEMCSKLTTRFPHFMVTQGHCYRRGSIGNLWLPIGDPYHGSLSSRLPDKRRFRSKIANFSHPCVWNAPLKEFPLELCNSGFGYKTTVMALPGSAKSLTICAFI